MKDRENYLVYCRLARNFLGGMNTYLTNAFNNNAFVVVEDLGIERADLSHEDVYVRFISILMSSRTRGTDTRKQWLQGRQMMTAPWPPAKRIML